jgi:outer membrane protein OmpA-like peptidoglycan-associated protein
VLTKELGFISLKGYVVDEKTMLPIASSIRIVNKTTGKEEALLNTVTGEFDIKLPGKNKYELTVEANGYLTHYEHITLTASTILNLPLKPIEVGQKVPLKNILFQKGTPDLTIDSYPELDRLNKFLSKNPTVHIELDGHTSNEGDAGKNLVLSEQRVTVIKNYLVSKGVDGTRIKVKAFGSQKPIMQNDTEEHRQLNRRVEFLILNK